ncbi:Wzt carbohydrate-binding domain-containing protein, partial [bacterium]|nr:Wzt carbohydrate-binding domain-containing protein [bacterium]
DHVRETESPKGTYGRPRWGSGEIQIESVSLSSSTGSEALFDTNLDLEIRLDYLVEKPIDEAVFGCQFYRSDGTYLNGSNHFWHEDPQIYSFESKGERGTVICSLPRLPLLPGDYYLSVCCYSLRDGVPQAIDHWERAYEFSISERTSDQHGLVAFDTKWTLER